MSDQTETGDGITITLTPAQTRVLLAMVELLLSPKKATIADLKLNVNATDNLLKSFRRRLRRALGQSEDA